MKDDRILTDKEFSVFQLEVELEEAAENKVLIRSLKKTLRINQAALKELQDYADQMMAFAEVSIKEMNKKDRLIEKLEAELEARDGR